MGNPSLLMNRVTKTYGAVRALDGLSLEVHEGELLSLVGPSGSGKTTALHLIAGLIEPDDGEISLFGTSLVGLQPKDREVAMVFQDGALYPHLTVAQNLAFPLKARGRKGTRAVPRMAERLGIFDLLHRYPSELSGGEAQRVALGRALIRKPKLFLLDEPLAGLDVPMRERLRGLIRDLVKETGVTTLCVTHEQNDAMAIGDRVGVMRTGRLVQCGTPREIYRNPSHAFVARFFGSPSMNFLQGTLEGGAVAGDWGRLPAGRTDNRGAVLLGFRPEDLVITEDDGGLSATVARITYFGAEVIVHLFLEDKSDVRVRMAARGEPLEAGSSVRLTVPPEALLLFDPDTGERL